MPDDIPIDLEALIRAIPDFPEPGILYRDITPLLQDGPALRQTLDWFETLYRDAQIDAVVGIESRGFIFGVPLADRLGVGFIPVRKPGKLPHDTHSQEYVLEYGSDSIEIHRDALAAGQRAVIIDDLLATGGTALATTKLVELCGADIHSLAFLVELKDLQGRGRLHRYQVESLLQY